MPSFDNYVMRHGEPWVQGLVEQIERSEGIRYHSPVPLEERWHVVMGATPMQQQFFAA